MTLRLLLLWTLAAFLISQGGSTDITVEEYTNAIKLSCKGASMKHRNGTEVPTIELRYTDENTGEYECVKPDLDSSTAESKIYVKFRTCDNCVEFDMTSIVSILVGNLVATTGIGVAVYLVASQTPTSRGSSNKKRSDKQQLVPNEVTNSDYQPLQKYGNREVYDELANRH